MKSYAFNLEWLSNKATELGFKLLSTEYKRLQGKYLWECQNGHQFTLIGYAVSEGSIQCKKCINLSWLKKVTNEASQLGIKLLSTEYRKLITKYKWECQNRHQWNATANSVIIQKAGCSICSLNEKYKQAVAVAQNRGFRLLDNVYKGSHTYYTWECPDFHQWEATLHNISQGSGCPYCNVHLNETKCRFIFEQLTDEKFIRTQKILPDRLELDGYCKELNLAFEYNGEQHYMRFSHISQKSFERIKLRDELKIQFCERYGIKLLVIPYTQQNNLEEYVRHELSQLGFNHHNKIINWNEYDPNPNQMREIIEKLNVNKVSFLKSFYNGKTFRLDLKCQICNYIWQTSVDCAKQSTGCCPKCKNSVRLSIEEVREFCKSKNIEFLSDVYEGRRVKYQFKCKEGHVWITSLMCLKDGAGCHVCSGYFKLTVEKVKKICSELGYDFLSNVFLGSKTGSYNFRCQKCNHIRLCKYAQIKSHPNCTHCFKSQHSQLTGDRNLSAR